MAQEEPNFSRTRRKRGRNRSNRILNLLIGIVVLLIIIVATSIFLRGGEEQVGEDVAEQPANDSATNTEDGQTSGIDEGTLGGNSGPENGEIGNKDEQDNDLAVGQDEQQNEEELTHSPGTVTIVPSEDKVIAETIINTSWQPIGTTQTGEHVSSYDGNSVDWEEKKKALAYATGLPNDSMIFWKIKNGGGPQKAVGIVSSRDKEEKYRVYLEWIDEKGWKPVKMDVLTTLDFNY